MFDLEKSITEWRQQMLASGIKTPVPLAELENHLRDDIAALIATGTPEAEAFQIATARIGSPSPLQTEFCKLGNRPSRPATLGLWFWAIGMVTVLAFLSKGFFAGRLSLLLGAHILSLTAGYSAAFLIGGFAIYYVCCHWCQTLSLSHEQEIGRAIYVFSRLAAALVVAGLVLGMLWSKFNRGHYLTGDPREIGALCAVLWLTGSSIVQRLSRVNHRAAALMGIAGNMVIGLAWFGAGVVAHGSGMSGYWPLDVLLFIHLFFLAFGILPTAQPVKA